MLLFRLMTAILNVLYDLCYSYESEKLFISITVALGVSRLMVDLYESFSGDGC